MKRTMFVREGLAAIKEQKNRLHVVVFVHIIMFAREISGVELWLTWGSKSFDKQTALEVGSSMSHPGLWTLLDEAWTCKVFFLTRFIGKR